MIANPTATQSLPRREEEAPVHPEEVLAEEEVVVVQAAVEEGAATAEAVMEEAELYFKSKLQKKETEKTRFPV